MLIYLQLVLLLVLFFQSINQTKVSSFLLYVLILLGAVIHYTHTFFPKLFFMNLGTNTIILFIICALLFLYSKFKLNKPFLKGIRAENILFIIILSVSFPTFTFLILFFSSLIFSFIVLLLGKLKRRYLVGIQSMFILITLFINLLLNKVNLYAF